MYIVHLGGIVPIHTIYFEYETESDSVKHICMRHSFTLEPQHSAVRDGNELITVFVRRGISRDRSRSPLKTSPDIVSHHLSEYQRHPPLLVQRGAAPCALGGGSGGDLGGSCSGDGVVVGGGGGVCVGGDGGARERFNHFQSVSCEIGVERDDTKCAF
ncbi:hypothetical protein QTP88_006644 [Uroleucon formosanum]